MSVFPRVLSVIQQDVGNRGLAKIAGRNLLNACPDDLEQACLSIVAKPGAVVAVITGFYIPTAQPPCGETDGPLGAVFLARALSPLGIRVVIGIDAFAAQAVETGLSVCGLRKHVPLVVLPGPKETLALGPDGYRKRVLDQAGVVPTHLLALERVGPSHTLRSLQEQLATEALGQTVLDFVADVPDEHQDRCHTMRGLDVTDKMSPAHWLFEKGGQTIGVGDGGNEIGMGKIPWEVIRDNIPNGARIACRIATRHLIVCGVSNWGAYALAAGVYSLLGKNPPPKLFDGEAEHRVLQAMVEKGPLVDGVLGKPSVTVDGLTWEAYSAVLTACGAAMV